MYLIINGKDEINLILALKLKTELNSSTIFERRIPKLRYSMLFSPDLRIRLDSHNNGHYLRIDE